MNNSPVKKGQRQRITAATALGERKKGGRGGMQGLAAIIEQGSIVDFVRRTEEFKSN